MRLFGPIVLLLSVALGAGGIAYQTRDGQCVEQAPPTPKFVESATPAPRLERGREPTMVVPLNSRGYNYRRPGRSEPKLFTGAEPAPEVPAARQKK